MAAGYLAAIGPLRRRAAPEAPVSGLQAAAFFLGLAVLYGAVGSPLHVLADADLLSAHMLEHALLTLAAVPLLLLGTPAWFWPPRWRRWSSPFALLPFHLAYGLYHVPRLYEAGLENDWVHACQHAVLAVTAALMWWPICGPEEARLPPERQLIYLLANGLASMPLVAALALAKGPLYPTYLHAAGQFGLTPLLDQELGVMIMMISAAAAYDLAALPAFLRLAQDTERPSSKWATLLAPFGPSRPKGTAPR